MNLQRLHWFLSMEGFLTEFPFLAESSSIMADDGSGSTRRMSSYALVDEDKAEQINQLKRSLSAYRGHLTRLYQEMELLFSNFGGQLEAFDRKCILDSLFTRYNSKAKDLLQLTTGSIEHEQVLQDHMREIEMKGFFDEEFARWFSKSCELATSHPDVDLRLREGPRAIPRDSVFVEDQPHPPSRENPREGIPHPSLDIP